MSKSSDTNSNFADRLRETRKRREMTQADLACKAGMQPSAIAHFEADRRKPSFDNIRALAQALSVTVDYLMGAKSQEATAFRNEQKLSDRDRDYIQDLINVMIHKKDGA